jgi:hypothetical protein
MVRLTSEERTNVRLMTVGVIDRYVTKKLYL